MKRQEYLSAIRHASSRVAETRTEAVIIQLFDAVALGDRLEAERVYPKLSRSWRDVVPLPEQIDDDDWFLPPSSA